MAEIDVIYNLFKARQIHVSLPWLRSCINWCKEENLPSNYTTKDLQFKVFEQWLLVDLRELEVPSLPPNLSLKQKFVLSGNYTLQMMYVTDISKPKYWQLQRIRNVTNKNLDYVDESSKRVLVMRLTDGVQEVDAMEYKPIPALTINLAPGIKVRLMGPMIIRRGKIMLENNSVKIIGGEVDDLMIPNAAENMLAKHFNLPLNDKPTFIEENILNIETNTQNLGNNTTYTNNSFQQHIQKNQIGNVSGMKNAGQPPLPANNFQILQTDRQHYEPSAVDYMSIEEQRINEEIDNLMELEREFESEIEQHSKTPDMFDDDNMFNENVLNNIEMPPTVIKTPTGSQKASVSTNNIYEKDLEDDVFANISIDAHLSQIDSKIQIKSPVVTKPVIWTVEKLVKNMSNITNGKFKIKAKFKSVVKRVSVIDDKFNLVITVEDDTDEVSVAFDSDVISDLVKCKPVTFLLVKDKDTRTPEAETNVMKALTCLRNALMELDNVMEVHISAKEKYPVVMKIL